MRREKALRIVLVVVGLIFLAGVYPLIMSIREGWQANKEDALPMMLSLYVTLGVFLLLAARNPSTNRSVIAFAAIVTVAGATPGDVASTVMSPAFFVACTTAMHQPENAFRDVPLSDCWSVGSPLPTPISLPAPETRNVTSLSVIGTTRPCAS